MADLQEGFQMARKPTISIIVPVYNTESHLERCLNSLVFQTCKDFEVIIVNDGSTDGSQTIIDYYSTVFPNLIVEIEKENGGLSSARRAGMSEARGRYVLFVDSDDWIHPSAVARLLDVMGDEACDVVFMRHAVVHDGDTKIQAAGKSFKNFKTSAKLKQQIIRYGSNSMWGKLWSKELLNEHALFPDMWHEDCADVPAILSYACSVKYIDTPLYFYYKGNKESITSTGNDARRRDVFKVDKICIIIKIVMLHLIHSF